MPDVLEDPPANPRPSIANLKPYDHARAILMGQRSGQVRRERAAMLKRPPAAPQVEPQTDDRLTLLVEQITRTRVSLNDDDCDYCDKCKRSGLQPHHRAALLRALCELLDQQRIARGEPLPGSRRPAQERAPSASSAARPLPMVPQPVQPVAQPDPSGVKPLGWEYDDPASQH